MSLAGGLGFRTVAEAFAAAPVAERVVTMDEVRQADEVWISSSSKELVPVVEVDGRPVGDGRPGGIWEHAQSLYSAGKFEF